MVGQSRTPRSLGKLHWHTRARLQYSKSIFYWTVKCPQQKLAAVQLYCCAWYGSTLWDLYGPAAEKVYRTWNTTCKIAHGVDRKTHTYFVQHYFSGQFPSVRQIIVKRSLCPLMYPKQQFILAKQQLSADQQENIALLDNLLNIRSNEIDEEIIEELNGLIDQICTN